VRSADEGVAVEGEIVGNRLSVGAEEQIPGEISAIVESVSVSTGDTRKHSRSTGVGIEALAEAEADAGETV
jgi:hypothetical protein